LTGFLKTQGSDSDGFYVLRLGTFLAFPESKLNRLAFSQRFTAIHFNGSEMYEYILLTFSGNKTITFIIVEPLDCACY